MSDTEHTPVDPPTPIPAPTTVSRPGWRTEELLLGALVILSLVGVAIADFSASLGFRYWLYATPVFAGVSILAGWARARRRGETVPILLRRQILHWLALPGAIYLVFMLEESGRINEEAAGLVGLIVVAVTAFLAGVHFDWRLAVLGVLLGVGAACAALLEEFFWFFFLPALAAVAIAAWWWRRSSRESAA